MKLKRFLIHLFSLAVFLLNAACATEAEQQKASFHFKMGLSYLGESNYTDALIELSEAEKLTPDDPDLLNKLALAYYYKKKYDLAEERYLRALKIRPDFSEARNNLAVNYLQMGRWDDAIAQLKRVNDDIFFREQEGAAINLGLAYLGKGDYQNALAVMRGVVINNPRNILAHLHLGRIYDAMGKPELAAGEFQKSLGINRDFAAAHYQMALVHLKLKEKTQARESFKEVVRIAPDSEIGQLSREYLDSLK